MLRQDTHTTTVPSYFLRHQTSPKGSTGDEGLLVLHVRPAKLQTLIHLGLKIWLQDPGTQSRDETRRQMWKCHCSEIAWRPPCSMGCFHHAQTGHSEQRWWMLTTGLPIASYPSCWASHPSPALQKQMGKSLCFESGFAHDMPIQLFIQ